MAYIVLCRYIGDDPDLRDNAARYPDGRTMPGTHPDKASADAEAVRHNSKPYTPYFYYVAEAPVYREEPTAAGIQLCIPGTERRPVENGKPAQLSLFG